MAVDPIVVVANLFKERYHLTSDEFIELNDKYAVLDFIFDCCESFCKTGDEGVLDDIHEYIEKQKLAERNRVD